MSKECEMQKYLKSLNPQPENQAILIYGRQYILYRDGVRIGIATWTKDDNVGDSFQTISENEEGEKVNQVWMADRWELLIKPDKKQRV